MCIEQLNEKRVSRRLEIERAKKIIREYLEEAKKLIEEEKQHIIEEKNVELLKKIGHIF